MTLYADGKTGHSKEIQHLAKSLKNKWFRALTNVEMEYCQPEGVNIDGEYLKHRQHMQRLTAARDDNDAQDKKKNSPSRDFKRGRFGIEMPTKNAFDFVCRPQFEMPMVRMKASEKGINGLRMQMEGIKKLTRAETRPQKPVMF
jgi:hypothetical protein